MDGDWKRRCGGEVPKRTAAIGLQSIGSDSSVKVALHSRHEAIQEGSPDHKYSRTHGANIYGEGQYFQTGFWIWPHGKHLRSALAKRGARFNPHIAEVSEHEADLPNKTFVLHSTLADAGSRLLVQAPAFGRNDGPLQLNLLTFFFKASDKNMDTRCQSHSVREKLLGDTLPHCLFWLSRPWQVCAPGPRAPRSPRERAASLHLLARARRLHL